MEQVRVGQIGLGRWGKNILRNLNGLGVLVAACDQDEATLSAKASEYPGVHFTSDYEEVLEDPTIQAVAIATPAVTHFKLVREALRAGKDVFVEKPLALRTREGFELVMLARQQKRILMVGHVLQYHPAVLKLRQMITSGELGKIHYLSSNRLNLGQVRTEENILWSFAPHDISVILSLINDEPHRVSAFGGAFLNQGVFDTTLSTLEFANDVKAHIYVSWLHPYKEQKLVVVGSKSMAVFDDQAKDKLLLYPHEIAWRDGKFPIAQMANATPVPIPPAEPLREELAHFVSCVLSRKEPKTNGEEALRVLRVLHALQSSLTSKEACDMSPLLDMTLAERAAR